MIPGEFIFKDDELLINADQEAIKVEVTNAGDRPIQVGSHYHFYEANNALSFDREKTYGMRLSIPAGASVRFEPGDEKEVELINFVNREVYGFHNEVDGPLDKKVKK